MYRSLSCDADFFRRKLSIGRNKANAYVEQLEDLASSARERAPPRAR